MQDLDEWEDGGLGRPPGLLNLYRGGGSALAEKETLEASSQSEGVLETQKALLEASQQVVELESRLGKQSEEYLAMESKFCSLGEEVVLLRARTEEAAEELERERLEKEELLERLRSSEEQKKIGGAAPEELGQRPEVEREDGDGASGADEPVALQTCQGKPRDCAGGPFGMLLCTKIYILSIFRPTDCWGGSVHPCLDIPTQLAPAPPGPPAAHRPPLAILPVQFWC